MKRRRAIEEPEVVIDAVAESTDSTVEGMVDGTDDPENAHSPMSPDGRISNQHTGLHVQEHSTGGHTPAS